MSSPVSPSSETGTNTFASIPWDRRPSANLPEVVESPTFESHYRPVHVPSTETVPPYGYAEAYDIQHRLSLKGRNLRQGSSPGLESVWDEEGAKEVVGPAPSDKQDYFVDQQPAPALTPSRSQKSEFKYPPGTFGYQGYDGEGSNNEREYCGLRKKWFFALVALVAVVILGVALGAGLGVGLGNSKNSNPTPPAKDTEYLIGGAIDKKYFSTTGAFNGSGIALASQSFSTTGSDSSQGTIVMYFQHWTGDIRYMKLQQNGNWVGGTTSEVVAVDAKNSTPISAVSYSVDGVDAWHIFYIDNNNMIRQRSQTNTTLVWVDGEINDAQLQAYDADQVGMQACWYGNDYGDSNYLHTPLPSSGNASTEYGMRIWYASTNNTFLQYGWRYGDQNWTAQGQFDNLNGHAGVGCYSWGPGTVTYVMFVNTDNAAEIYWRDTNSNLTSTPSHPINEWTKVPFTIPNLDPSTSLGYTNFFYAQSNATDMMDGYNITWAAENTTIVSADSFTVQGEAGIPGTHLSVSAIPDSDGGNNIVVFYQTVGNDITEFTRDLVAGQWTSAAVQIPQQ